MEKSVASPEYKIFVELLAEARERAGFTQAELGVAIGETQSTISKIERAERRIDVIELLTICRALTIAPANFLKALEEAIARNCDALR